MYEQTISIDYPHGYMLDYLAKQLNNIVSPIGGVVVSNDSSTRRYIAVASLEVYGKQVSAHVDNLLLDVLAIGYKQQFIISNLNFGMEDFAARTLINCMSVFDSYSDKKSIAKHFSHENVVSIDGYYNFSMRDVRKRWAEVVQLANDNKNNLSSWQSIVQFIDYIADSIPSSVSNMSVIVDKDKYCLLNGKNHVIINTPMPLVGSSYEDIALIDILLHNPKSVTVYATEHVSKQFVAMCEQLFAAKIVSNS